MSKTPADGGSIVDGSAFETDLKSPELAPYWLSALIDSADDAIISKTLEGIITSWNQGAERIFGFTAEEAIGNSITIIIPPDHLDEEPQILARLRAGERIEHFETVRQRKDGKRLDISLTVSPIKGPDGRIVGASKIARDVTDQRRARRDLDEATERLRLALAASHLGDWSWDAETDTVSFSETAARIFGVPPGPELTWTEMRNLLDPPDRERARMAIDEALANHTDYDIEYRVTRPDNSETWISARGRGLYGADGRVLGMLGFVQDISETKRTEETLREQADALRTLNEVGQLISAELDLHKTVQAVTDAATEITGARFGSFFYNVLNEEGASYMLYTLAGVSREAFAHLPMPRATELFGPTFRGEGVVRIADVKKDPRYGRNSPYYGMPEGHLPVTSYLAVPVVSRSGEVLGGLFFGHPEAGQFTRTHEQIVEGVAAHAAVALENARLYKTVVEREQQLEAAVAAAREADRRKDEFLAMLAHELRNPLAPIATALQIMSLSGDAAQREREVIDRQVRHLARLVDDLLDVSRITRGKIQLSREKVEIGGVIAKAVELAAPLVEKRNHQLTVESAGSEPLVVDGDPVRLAQIVHNLLSNAAKYTPGGGHLRVSARREGSQVVVRVVDDGIGIAPELLPHVFELFVQ